MGCIGEKIIQILSLKITADLTVFSILGSHLFCVVCLATLVSCLEKRTPIKMCHQTWRIQRLPVSDRAWALYAFPHSWQQLLQDNVQWRWVYIYYVNRGPQRDGSSQYDLRKRWGYQASQYQGVGSLYWIQSCETVQQGNRQTDWTWRAQHIWKSGGHIGFT